MIRTTFILASIMAFSLHSSPFASPSKETKRVETSIDVLDAIQSTPDKTIPNFLLKKAYGIAVIPGVIKGAAAIGGRYGKGVLMVKSDSGWSYPSFITIKGGSIGWQLGAQSTDVVLVFRTKRSVENVSKGTFTLGADASIAAGPVGRSAEATTNAKLKAEIYSYARNRGFFVGVSLEGSSLSIDKTANKNFYNEKISANDIFEDKVTEVPKEAAQLQKTMNSLTGIGAQNASLPNQ